MNRQYIRESHAQIYSYYYYFIYSFLIIVLSFLINFSSLLLLNIVTIILSGLSVLFGI